MGLDVELYAITRDGPGLAVVGDTRFRFAEAVGRIQFSGSTPMLDKIDLYGSHVMSPDEMPALLGEVDRMMAAATDEREREVLLAVRGLAVRCGTDPDLRLRFIGD